MPQVAREGDTSDHGGGPIKEPAIEPTVFVNGKPIAINRGGGTGADVDQLWDDNGSDPDTHPLGKSNPGPSEGSNTVFAGGFGVHRFRDDRFCGAETITASNNVWADEKPQIRVPGATVQDPIASLAAPTNLTFPYTALWAFSGKRESDCGGQVVYNGCNEDSPNPGYRPEYNKNGFYTLRSTALNLKMYELGAEHFQFIGTKIPFKVNFPEGLEDFEVPDIDLASKGNIPEECNNANQELVTGIRYRGFPSFGNVEDLYIEMEDNTALTNTLQHDTKTGHFDDEFYHLKANAGVIGTTFIVANESGNVFKRLPIVVISAWPNVLPELFTCGDTD